MEQNLLKSVNVEKSFSFVLKKKVLFVESYARLGKVKVIIPDEIINKYSNRIIDLSIIYALKKQINDLVKNKFERETIE